MYPKYIGVIIIAFQKMYSLSSLLLRRIQHNNHNNNNNNNGALVARGGWKGSIPAINLRLIPTKTTSTGGRSNALAAAKSPVNAAGLVSIIA